MSSNIFIERPPEQVWAYLGDPANVAEWDRGVSRVEAGSTAPHGAGFTFDTIAHERLNLPDEGRMSYRVSLADPAAGRCVVELTSRAGNARFFKRAEWQFEVKPSASGSMLACAADFTLRARYLFLGPIFYLKRDAILLDLTLLKNAIERV